MASFGEAVVSSIFVILIYAIMSLVMGLFIYGFLYGILSIIKPNEDTSSKGTNNTSSSISTNVSNSTNNNPSNANTTVLSRTTINGESLSSNITVNGIEVSSYNG